MIDLAQLSFDYLFDVTETPIVYLTGRLRHADHSGQRHLVGYEPVLEVEEYSPSPWKLYARVRVSPSDPRNAVASAVTFSVERGLMRCLQLGDILHFRGTCSGGFAVAILRGASLVAAAGALSEMPLGDEVAVRTVKDGVPTGRFAVEVTPGRDGQCLEPVEVRAAGERVVLHGGRPTLSGYDVFVRAASAGPWPCVSIERRGMCPETAAHTSAQLFDQEGLTVSPLVTNAHP